MADRDFDPAAEPDRNVILYGNAATNEAWTPLLGGSPVRVDKEFDRGRTEKGSKAGTWHASSSVRGRRATSPASASFPGRASWGCA